MCYAQRHKHCSDTKRMFASNNERWKLATHRVDAGLDIRRAPPPPRPHEMPRHCPQGTKCKITPGLVPRCLDS